MEECYFLKVTLLHGCFSRFLIVRIPPNQVPLLDTINSCFKDNMFTFLITTFSRSNGILHLNGKYVLIQMISLTSMFFNPFHANIPFLYFLKTSQNFWFSDVFRKYRNGTLSRGKGFRNETLVQNGLSKWYKSALLNFPVSRQA